MPESLPTDQQLSLVHCPDYLAAFSSGTLDDQRVRRWVGGGGWVWLWRGGMLLPLHSCHASHDRES